MIKVVNWLTDTPAKTIASAILMVVVIGGLDYSMGYEIALASFYLLPIMLIAWRLHLRWGLAVSALSALVWLANNHWLADRVFSHPLIPYWNALMRFTFFAVCTILINRINLLFRNEKKQSQMKSSMIHMVSHEFNNNLAVLSSGLFLLKEMETAPVDENRAELITVLEDTQIRMAIYVKNILNEARMEDGRFKLDKKKLVLRELAAECAAPVRELLKHKNITLVMKMPETPLFVSADRDALALVVSNLLGNAMKYTPQNGRIEIEVLPCGDPPEKVIFSVDDSGIGIPLADLKKITAGFYRTEEGKAVAGGFGLGLKISNELLTLHGSHLEISSEKGKGSHFSFEFPAWKEPGQA